MNNQPKGNAPCEDERPASACQPSIAAITWRLRQECGDKHVAVAPVGQPLQHPDPPPRPPVLVDLVLLIDTSASMADEAKELSGVVKAAVTAEIKQCRADLRVCWFGIEGAWAETDFTQSYRKHLHCLGVPDHAISGRRRDSLPKQGAQEDGARAIVDIAHYFDWRPGALRLILFLGDEALEGGDPAEKADHKALERAIVATRACSVKVFTYAGSGPHGGAADLMTEFQYRRLSSATGGQSYSAPPHHLARFRQELHDLICREPNDEIPLPAVRPRFRLHWGDSVGDRIETDDFETICLAAQNPYTNVIFHDLVVVCAIVTRAGGSSLPLLPDGSLSVLLTPARLIVFGDLGPYQPHQGDDLNWVMRELILWSRGAAAGEYLLTIHCCYHTEYLVTTTDDFKLQLVASYR